MDTKNLVIKISISAIFLFVLSLSFSGLIPNIFAESSLSDPGTMADDATVGTDAWDSVDNAKTSNDSYASVYGGVGSTTTYSHYLKATNFGFAIPDGAVINGIKVTIERRTIQGTAGRIVRDSEIRIVKSDGSTGMNKSAGHQWSSTDTTRSYGNSTDPWGASWSASDINDSDFGVVLSVSLYNESPTEPASADVDHIEITVYYIPICGDTDGDGITDVVCAAGNIVAGAPDYTYQLTEDLGTCSGSGLVIGADNITIDGNGHTMTGNLSANFGIDNTGGYDGITIKNFGNITNFGGGIHFANSTGGAIQNNTISSNNPSIERFGYGIFLSSSSNNTVTNNTVNCNLRGIVLDSSSGNVLTDNNVGSNWEAGIFLYPSSSGNDFINNTLFVNLGNGDTCNSGDNICDSGTNDYSDNKILYPICNDSNMLTFSEVGRMKGVNDTVSFSVSAFNLNGGACDGCTTITTSPSETVTIDSESGNDITGHFTVTRPGTYSLIVTVTDSDNNTTKKSYLFFVDAAGSQTTRYYIRGVNPTHGQFARANDLRSMLLTIPTKTEVTRCMGWVQNSADEIPDFPLANLSSVDTHTFHFGDFDEDGYIGIERFPTCGHNVDYSESAPRSPCLEPRDPQDPDCYVWTDIDFNNLSWTMEYPWSWYWLTLKMVYGEGGHSAYESVIWRSTPNEPSYADFTYEYTTTPAVKSISNADITLLSATEPVDDENNATIVLDGTGSTNIVMDDYNRPFLDYTTTISSDGTATLQATGLTGETTINSVQLDTSPSSGSVDIDITTWNTSGDYYKEWEETANTPGIMTTHTVGDLEASTYYIVKKDGNAVGNYLSNALGRITFTCLAGSTFTVENNNYNISGQIALNGGSSDVTDVLLTSSGETNFSTNPEVGGNYILPGVRESNYTVTPSLADYHFFPRFYFYNSLDSDKTNQDFTGLHETYDSEGDNLSDWWELENFGNLDQGADDNFDEDDWTNSEEFQLGYDPNNACPGQPVNSSPADNNVSLTPTLKASDYSDVETNPHLFTEWQIAYDVNFSELVFVDTTPINKQTIPLPLAVLKPATTYYSRVRYSDIGGWSKWSVPVEFTTESLNDFLTENEGITLIEKIRPNIGVVAQAYRQNPDNLSGLPCGYQFCNDAFSFRIEGLTPGATVEVTFQLDEIFQQYHKWLKYYPSLEEWDDTYADGDNYVSGVGTKSLTLKFTDGGVGDIDGLENGVIVDPSGPGEVEAGSIFGGNDGVDNEDEQEKWCLIATAAYGTPTAKEVGLLREFRNKYLLRNPIGEFFVETYYRTSPKIASFIANHPVLKKVVRGILCPVVWISREVVE